MKRLTTILLMVAALMSASAQAFEFETVMVEMRDGIHLATDAFWPSRPGTYPTILIRTTYGRDMIADPVAEEVCDQLKFALVVQDTRGRYDSEGVDDVFMSDGWGEHQDGYDTVEWIVQQPWSDGKVGLFGASALGITSFLAVGSLHPAIKAAHVGIAPWVFYDVVYQNGCYRDALVTDWLEDQDALYMLDTYKEHPVYDELWESLDMRTRADLIDVPMYLWGGWYDVFTSGPLQAWMDLTDTKISDDAPQRLLMGPWTHTEMGALGPVQGELVYPMDSVIPLYDADPFSWFARFLKGQPRNNFDEAWPVRFYLMGDVDEEDSAGNRWLLARTWPVPSRERYLYLEYSGRLTWTPDTVSHPPRTFVYDPADPSPTIGGGELSLDQGPYDQTPLLERDDVLAFTTDVLDAPVTVVGEVTATLFVSSDAPDTDFTVRLADVYPDGRAMLVTDGIAKVRYHDGMEDIDFLTPGEVIPLQVHVGRTAIAFDRGHRIMVLVSSSNARRFIPSRNNDDDIWGDEPAQVATNALYMDSTYPSFIVLPEPEPGATARLEHPDWQPSPDTVDRVLRKMARGRPLTASEEDVIAYDAGRRLLEAMLARVAHP